MRGEFRRRKKCLRPYLVTRRALKSHAPTAVISTSIRTGRSKKRNPVNPSNNAIRAKNWYLSTKWKSDNPALQDFRAVAK